MAPFEIDLVQTSFDKVLPQANEAAAAFYRRLFELDPALRRIFHSDLGHQGKKLMHMLGIIVDNLHHPERFVPGIHALGRRHVEYGVRHDHYDTFRTALLWTLEHLLGEDWTFDMKRAWTAAFRFVATAMREATTTDADMELTPA